MKFKCSSSLLQKGVNIVEKAVSQKTNLPIMENIFMELKDHKLKMMGNDLELGIEYFISIENIEQEGAVLLKAKTISSIVSKLDNQLLSLQVDENKKIIINADKVDFNILGTDVSEYPVFPQVEEGLSFELEVRDLKELLKYTIFAVSFDETKEFLNGILIKNEEDYLYFVSTDGYRLSLKRKKITKPATDFSAIVPFRVMNELYKILQNIDPDAKIKLNISTNQVSFMMDGFLLVSRVIQGTFPDYKQVLPKEFDNVITVGRRNFIQAAERASIIASVSNNVVKLIFSDVLEIKANAPKMGGFNEEINITNQNIKGIDNLKVAFNVRLLLDVMKTLEADDVLIEVNDELKPCVIRSVADEDYTYIIMPIRTSDYKNEDDS
ncbi:DNA polymerase III subunit beta [bacterium]|nr:DNA polymerase III subunit beta [bacterium]MBT3580887.1 DNA polymerase III subunit beta [bacterium]MBT4552453.1 DNA polymerase III subunit beta [bacterium]MBT7088635.1 DNA polymerase III subunit beta [bacterium]